MISLKEKIINNLITVMYFKNPARGFFILAKNQFCCRRRKKNINTAILAIKKALRLVPEGW
jgi:hypothetical protein